VGVRLKEIARLFLKLGVIGFGGPAAHIAMMDAEVVRVRRWMTHEQFLDLVGATNLIPGPNSTEMAIHIGLMRAGWRGLLVAGTCFILPAALIVWVTAWAYVRVGGLPQVAWLLYGVKPVIIAVVVQALWALGTKAVKGPITAAAGAAVIALGFLGVNEVALLFGGGCAVMAARSLPTWAAAALGAMPTLEISASWAAGAAPGVAAVSLATRTGIFLKIGSILFGSGYVLLAFLRADLVQRLGWLSDQQLLDAIAVGQFTPGPVLTTATFVGYLVAGTAGAILATLAIFLPSFLFVAASNPLIRRLRRSTWAAAFLDGVNVASLGLMAVVTWQLGRAAVIDWPTAGMATLAGYAVFRMGVNSAWLVAGGALIGFGVRLLS
jgi:chromate transporter